MKFLGLSRRDFLRTTSLGTLGAACGCHSVRQSNEVAAIHTVTGPVAAGDLGTTLIHEHVVVDFIGAQRTSPARYDHEQAFQIALPRFQALRARGVRTLVECTPRFIGRDVALLRRLSAASGVRIVTNSGWYAAVNHKYLPPEASSLGAEEIAALWLTEWRGGIEGTGIRPGFLKLGTGSGPLPAIDAKLLRAAAQVHKQTGLTIFVHTGDGAAALDEIRILREAGVAPSALVWVHAQNDAGPIQLQAARLGARISLDGFSLAKDNPERYAKAVLALREAGWLQRVLISHDDGWAVDGDAPTGNALKLFGNGNPAPYESIFASLLPMLRQRGFTDAEIDQLLIVNPREALTPRIRLLNNL